MSYFRTGGFFCVRRSCFVDDGKPAATIVVREDAPYTHLLAAKELNEYFAKMSGATLPVVTDEDSNSFCFRCWKGWGTFSQKTWCRYYFGWANEFPRQIEGAIAENGLFNLTLRHPIKHSSAEHPIDSESKVCPNAVSTWDSSAISAWCINRIWWDPTQEVRFIQAWIRFHTQSSTSSVPGSPTSSAVI